MRVYGYMRSVPATGALLQSVHELAQELLVIRKVRTKSESIERPAKVHTQTVTAPEDELGDRLREASGAENLLLEIVRRAAFDWVLYRESPRPDRRQLADDAYIWLFEEDEDHPHWAIRQAEGKSLTSLLSICEALGIRVPVVRAYVKNLTVDKILSTGRQPETGRTSPLRDVAIHTRVAGGDSDYDAFLSPMFDTRW